jgi:eukaryotic-like serine/threonine-protein kinase
MGDDAELVARILVAEGILSADEVHMLAAMQDGQGLLERLRADGRVSGDTLASLRARLNGAAPADPAMDLTPLVLPRPRPRGESPAVEAPAFAATDDGGEPDQGSELDGAGESDDAGESDRFPVPDWDRYEPIRLLGQGGMGRVFLARDLRLGREVAIKFMLGEDPQLARRIVAEARAQARVNHDRVCKVYEVGEIRGRVYIAMQYINGRSLSELGSELTLEEKVIVMREAALGMAEAHRVGLIHRDLKPSNIMVERAPDGELRPYVMDFGVARDWMGSATLTGAVVGTPHYMAPEQAQGEGTQLDRRADVYSLGATLYALLTRRPPIEGSNALAVLLRVCTDEPVRPRAIDPDVPADLEAIAMRCLEKERAARYDSARAFADDLARFLAGEPVAARASAGVRYRVRKWLRRRRRLVAGVAIAAALVAVAVSFAVRERLHAARRAELARRFTERVEWVESMARYAALAPPHDLRPDRARFRVKIDELAADIRDGGELAEGPGRYALGRGHLALGDDARAAAELTAAWDRGYREPRVAYMLALAEGRLYQQALRDIERLPPALRDEQRQAIQRRYRDPALAHLRSSQGADAPSLDYVAALIAYYEERHDDALRRLDAIGGQGLAWFYEAPLLRGEILGARAMASRAKVSPDQTAADFAAGRRALAEAAASGRSDPAVHVAQGELEQRALRVEMYGAGEIAAPFDAGIAAAGRALAIDPDDVAALTLRVGLQRNAAEYRGNLGEDVTALLSSAVVDARRAVELAPSESGAKLVLASAYRQWGEFRGKRGEDPSTQLEAALRVTDSIAPREWTYSTHVLVGLIHKVWTDYQDLTGQDAEDHRTRTIDAYTQALRLNDRGADAWQNLGITYFARATAPHSHDAEADLARALKALERGSALEPGSYVPYFYQGEVYRVLAECKQARGADPAPDRDRAIERYGEGLKVNRKSPHLYNGISVVQAGAAEDAVAHGRDPTAFLDQASDAAARAIDVAPDQGDGYNNLGDALVLRATFERAQGRDPRPAAREAIHAFTQALDRNPGVPTYSLNLGESYRVIGGYEIDHSRDPGDSLALARRHLEHALARDPTLSDGQRLLAEVGELEARLSRRSGRPVSSSAAAERAGSPPPPGGNLP